MGCDYEGNRKQESIERSEEGYYQWKEEKKNRRYL